MVSGPQGFDVYLPEASSNASSFDALFLTLTVVSLGIVFVVGFLTVFFAARYRFGTQRDRRARAPSKVQHFFELGWTGIPILIFIGLFGWASSMYMTEQRAPPDATVIHVVAKQWMWKFEHPGGQRELDELHLPKGQPVRFVMTSEDVIHSLFVPPFRLKKDLVPGRYTSMWLTPVLDGEYRILCAELCGTKHSEMGGRVVVMEPQDFQKWLERQVTPGSSAAQGKRLFMSLGCSGCHAQGSTVHAPKLDGLYGRQVALSDGSSVRADESYIRDSILLPNSQVVAGFDPIMPSFTGKISEEDIFRIVSYIQSLPDSDSSTP